MSDGSFQKEIKIFSCVYSQTDTQYLSYFHYVSTKVDIIKMKVTLEDFHVAAAKDRKDGYLDFIQVP